MTPYLVVTSERAALDIEDNAAWWAGERSVEQAERWYQGIREAIAGLATSPDRHGLAVESPDSPHELRELHYGIGKRPTHRILFTIAGQTVLILTVRHVSRGELRPSDL